MGVVGRATATVADLGGLDGARPLGASFRRAISGVVGGELAALPGGVTLTLRDALVVAWPCWRSSFLLCDAPPPDDWFAGADVRRDCWEA